MLSNFYMPKVTWNGEQYKSPEHIYQVEKIRMNGRPEVADKIKQAETALDAKRIVKIVYTASG